MGLAAKRETGSEEEEAEKEEKKRGILGFLCFIKGKYGVSVFIPGVILGIL